MRFQNSLAALLLVFTSSGAWAASTGQMRMHVGGEGQGETLRDQRWGLTSQLGGLAYTDNTGSAAGRFTLGIGFDWNVQPLLRSEAPREQYVGISSGFLYSHPGAADSDFLGTGTASGSNSNLFMIPIDLKLGYAMTDSFRFSVRGGGNLIYRSNAAATDLGPGSNSSSELWKIYPNVGVDADFQLTKNLNLTIRPDVTMTPGNDLYVATIGATYVGF